MAKEAAISGIRKTFIASVREKCRQRRNGNAITGNTSRSVRMEDSIFASVAVAYISHTIFPAINRESAWDSNDFLVGLVWEMARCAVSGGGTRPPSCAHTHHNFAPETSAAMGKTRLKHVHRQNTNVLRRRRAASQVKARLVLCRPCKLAFVIKLHSFIFQSIVLARF